MSVIKRDLASLLGDLMLQYPMVTITGPRQSGKTTLVREAYPKKAYFNLEEPDVRERILADPKTFFAELGQAGAILDEIQQAPELMSYIQVIVDEAQSTGQFLLTGSQQLHLHQAVSQSLAGRTALLDLLPLTIQELNHVGIRYSLDDYLFHGFYPGVYSRNLNPTMAYRNYVKTYVERDVRQLVNLKDLALFQRFIQLSSGRVGSVINIESLCNDVGVTHNTLNSWLSLLEVSYLLIRLQPYYENFGKRIIKSPKIYFTDVGLLSYLLGLESADKITHDRMRGYMVENLVIMEFFKARVNLGKEPDLYYFRDNHGHEVDLIVRKGHSLIPVEIKSTATFNEGLLKNIRYYQKLVGDRAPIGFLIYGGEESFVVDNIHIMSFRNVPDAIKLIDEAT